MNEEIRAAMRQTYQEMGEAILQDERRMASFLADILGNRYPGERLLLRQLVQTGLPRMIAEGAATAENLPQKAAYLAETYPWREDATLAAARVWFETLTGEISPHQPKMPKLPQDLASNKPTPQLPPSSQRQVQPPPQKAPKPEKLIWSAEKGDVQRVSALLEAGADPSARDRLGWTALMWAARSGHADCVRLLIEAGADINAADRDNKTALMKAVETKHTDCVRLLIEAGADVDADDGTALMLAAEGGDVNLVRMLIKTGADADAGGALVGAAEHGYDDCVRLLIKAGADVNADVGDVTVLEEAVELDHVEYVRLLLAAGADANANSGKALFVAALYGHTDCVRSLVPVQM